MRIAICFSGQIRTAIESSENLIRYFGEEYPNCDFFIHTWNMDDDKITGEQTMVDKDRITKLKEIYNPKEIVIDDYNEINSIENFDRGYVLYYTFMRSVDLKREYEIKNGFQYDYVIKLRMDLIFNNHRRLSMDINEFPYKEQNGVWIENPPRRFTKNTLWVDDIFFIGTSENMDIMSKYYRFIKEYLKVGHYVRTYENSLPKYLFDRGITIFNNRRDENGYVLQEGYVMDGYTVYRESCKHLSPMTDFLKILHQEQTRK